MPRITKRVVDNLEPDSRFTWDDQLKGFGVRQTPNGVTSFVVQYRNAFGKTRRFTVGRYGNLAPDRARKIAAKRLAEVAEGRDPAGEKRVAREVSVNTFGDLAEQWSEAQVVRVQKGALRETTSREYHRGLRADLLPRFGRKALDSLNREDIRRFHEALSDRPVIANRLVSLLAQIWRWGEGRGYCDGANPGLFVDKFAERRRERVFTHDELRRLGEAMQSLASDGELDRWKESIVRLTAFSGARPGEIRRLRWDGVDLDRRVLRLSDEKTGDRTLWINKPMGQELESLPHNSEWLFPSPRKRDQPIREMRKSWARALKVAEVTHGPMYVLRHGFASESEAVGHSLLLTAALLGHSTKRLGSTSGYVHHVPDDVRRASERVAGRIADCLDGVQIPRTVVPLR